MRHPKNISRNFHQKLSDRSVFMGQKHSLGHCVSTDGYIFLYGCNCFGNIQSLVGTHFWTPKQIEANLGEGVFTPTFEYEYRLLKGDLLLKTKH